MQEDPFRVEITLRGGQFGVERGGVIRCDRGGYRRVVVGEDASARGIILIAERFRLLRPNNVGLIRGASWIGERRRV